MRFLLRLLLLIPLAIAMAAFISGVFLGIAGVVQPTLGGALLESAVAIADQVVNGVMAGTDALDRVVDTVTGASRLVIVLLLLPAALVAVITEAFGLRSCLLQMILAGLIAALLPWAALPDLLTGQALSSSVTGLMAAMGALAGFVYWLIAGRSAGSDPLTIEERATVAAPPRTK